MVAIFSCTQFWQPFKQPKSRYVCAAGKIYPMSGATCVSFQPILHIAQKLTRCQPPTHHIHIQSIYNLKRGLVVLTHQLLSCPITEYNALGIRHNVIGRYTSHLTDPYTISNHALLCQFLCCWLK